MREVPGQLSWPSRGPWGGQQTPAEVWCGFRYPGASDFPFWGRPGGKRDTALRPQTLCPLTTLRLFLHLSPGDTMALPSAAGEWGIPGNKALGGILGLGMAGLGSKGRSRPGLGQWEVQVISQREVGLAMGEGLCDILECPRLPVLRSPPHGQHCPRDQGTLARASWCSRPSDPQAPRALAMPSQDFAPADAYTNRPFLLPAASPCSGSCSPARLSGSQRQRRGRATTHTHAALYCSLRPEGCSRSGPHLPPHRLNVKTQVIDRTSH